MKFPILNIALAVALTGTAASALTKAEVDSVRDTAVQAIEKMDLDTAIAYTQDPTNGMSDLETTGLHTWAIGRDGVIVYDHSNQTDPGMDLSEFPAPSGAPLPDWIAEIVATNTGGLMDIAHPTTSANGTAYISCNEPNRYPGLFVCAMAWGF